jgi:hypothetical protein
MAKEEQAELVLGIKDATTEYSKDGLYWKGTTTWTDKRNDSPMRLETRVRKEVYGFKKFKDYHHESFLNDSMIQSHSEKTKNQGNMKKAHSENISSIFMRMKMTFHEDPNTDFSCLHINR